MITLAVLFRIRREKLKYSFCKNLHILRENGNHPITFNLGHDLPQRIKEANKSSKLLLQSPKTTRFSNGSLFAISKNQYPSNKNFHTKHFL